MANIDEIVTNHGKELEGVDIKGVYENINSKLSNLGYEVLINKKADSEFIPSGRFKDVVTQRDGFKTQVDNLNSQLEELQKNSNSDSDKQRLQEMIDNNDKLLKQLEESNITNEIIVAANDAISPKDLIPFINKDKIKINSKGVVTGVEEEVDRLREEKPYLFNKKEASRGGRDPNGSGSESSAVGMNTMIRKAAGKTF